MIDEARLSDLLARGDIVWISPGERDEVEALAEVVEIPGATFAGGPVILRTGDRLAALEQGRADAWVLRPFEDETGARTFLARRREEYDRMWDGCGCRIDYEK